MSYPREDPTNSSLVPTQPGSQDKLPPGAGLGVRLLWLCFGLPASSLLFLGAPVILALIAVARLERADVPLEVWSELEPWIALALLMASVNGWASFAHRRALGSKTRAGLLIGWFTLGGINAVAWAALLGLEQVPRTELHPLMHYLALSGLMVWTGLTLAWASGRVLSAGLGRVERRALRSATLRGGLATAGPLSLAGFVAVGAATMGLDANELVDDSRMLVEGNFKDDWSLSSGDGGEGSSTSPPADSSETPREWFDRCINEIYGGPGRSLYKRAVERVSSYSRIDAESVAADAALGVCGRGRAPDHLQSFYFRAVENGARSSHRKLRSFGECVWPVVDPKSSREATADCISQQLCRMPEESQKLLRLSLTGHSLEQLAEALKISKQAAKKRRWRATRELRERSRECLN